MEFMKLVKENIKKLLGNKDVKEIIKFVATNVIQFASSKFSVNRYKYDKNDLKQLTEYTILTYILYFHENAQKVWYIRCTRLFLLS